MLVIEKNTEKQLMIDMKNCWLNDPGNRCLHLRFSKIQHKKDGWLDELVQIFTRHFEGQEAQFYRCNDQDVFIVARYLTGKRTDGLLLQLSALFSADALRGISSLFEIGVDWPYLKRLCEKKIEDLKIKASKSQAQEKQEVAQISREESISRIDQGLIHSIAERRAQRDAVEVMVVEDDLFSQKLVQNALKEEYQVSMMSDGQGAIMGYVAKAPDILFLDIGLPDIDGHKVLKKLFEIDPDAYVVMFSGNSDKENVMKAIQIGAKGFVGKPFTQDKILQYISKSPFVIAKQGGSGI